MNELDAALTRIRTIRKVCVLLHARTQGNLPSWAYSRWQSEQCPSPHIVAEFDPEPLAKWEAALTALATNADAPLPAL